MTENVKYDRKSLSVDELQTQLILKDLQLRSLFNITQAINDNVSISGLYNMYKEFLSWEMGIEKLVLFSSENDEWKSVCNLNYDYSWDTSLIENLKDQRGIYTVKAEDPAEIQDFLLVIPVYHKDKPIAVALIGDFKDEVEIHTKIQFIRAITNIVAVAIENKKLFKLSLEQSKLQRDLEFASEVQKWLLPKEFQAQLDYDSAFIYKPHYNVGGDYFDCIPYDDKSIVVCISDISGKGVSAAILMANLQAQLKSLMHMHDDMDDLVRDLNRKIETITRADKFLTFFVAHINFESKIIRYVNAGHNPPILSTKNGIIDLTKGCVVLGAVRDIEEINVGEVNYDKDDLLFMYTDGLVDIKNTDEDYFDRDRVIRFLEKRKNNTVAEIITALDDKIENFNGSTDFPDDIAVLAIKF